MKEKNIFISVGSTCNEKQENFVKAIEERLRSENLIPNTIGRNKFTSDSPLKSIADLMDECSGTIVIALERTFIKSGFEKRGGTQESSVHDVKIPTPWNQIEAAMAYAKGKPLMVIIEEGLKNEGLLEKGHDWFVMWIKPEEYALNTPKFNGFFSSWKSKVENYETNKVIPQQQIDPSTLTVGYILKNLKTAHLWAVLGALIILLTGSFSFGRFVSTLTPQKVEQAESNSNTEKNGKPNEVAGKLITELKKRSSFISSKIIKPLYVEDIRSLELAFVGNFDYLTQWEVSDVDYYVYEDLMRKSCDELVNKLNTIDNSYQQQVLTFRQAYSFFSKLKKRAFEINKIRADHNAVELTESEKEFYNDNIKPNLFN